MNPSQQTVLIHTLQSPTVDLASRHEAFTALVLAYQDMACGYAFARLGDWPRAQDAAQQAFIIAYQQIAQLREPMAFATWLQRILASQCTRLVYHRQEQGLPLALEDSLVSTAPEPEAAVAASALRQEILSAVHALPYHEREAVLLYYINGYSQAEVAAFLELDPPTVRKRLQRAREHLKETMMELLKDSLAEERPSQSDAFVRAVQLATTLAEAAFEAQVSVLEAALLEGLDPNEAGANGQTLLHWAAQRGNVEAVTLLLRNGADPAIVDRQGRTPRRVALDAGQPEIVTLLDRAINMARRKTEAS